MSEQNYSLKYVSGSSGIDVTGFDRDWVATQFYYLMKKAMKINLDEGDDDEKA